VEYTAQRQQMADLVTEFRRSNEPIPTSVVRERSAETVREILKVNRARSKNTLKIEEYLDNPEFYLLSVAESKIGEKYVDEWMVNLLKVQVNNQTVQTKPITKYSLGVPQDEHGVRMQASGEFHQKIVEHYAEETVLIYNFQEDVRFSFRGDIY